MPAKLNMLESGLSEMSMIRKIGMKGFVEGGGEMKYLRPLPRKASTHGETRAVEMDSERRKKLSSIKAFPYLASFLEGNSVILSASPKVILFINF